MKLHSVAPRRGATWMRQGFAIFARQPLGFCGMFAAFLFLLFVSALLPWIGSLLPLVALPLVSLGFMIGTRRALGGRMPSPAQFFEPLQQGRPRALALLQLGIAYALATWLVVALARAVDGGALDAAMRVLSQGGDARTMSEQLAQMPLEMSLLLHTALLSLVSVPFWHAPALIHWGGQGVAQSLFSSTFAIWRNKGAFTVFGLAWCAVLLGFAMTVGLAFTLLGVPMLGALALMPASLVFWAAFYASLWFTFADCFSDDAEAQDTPHHPVTTDTP